MAPAQPTTLILNQCIARLGTGDAAARKDLIGFAMRRLETIAQRSLRRNFRLDPMLDTGDIVQEASIRLMRALENVQINDLRHFLNLSAVKIRQTLLDIVRKPVLPAARQQPDDSGAGAAIDQCGTVTLDPASLARWTEFHQMIQNLPDDLREVVDLLWYHELSQADAADVLGVAEKTIGRRWLKARLQLGEWLSS